MSGRLAQIFVPTNHPRYASLVAWAKHADTKWWRLGKSSDGRDGIWIPYGLWDRDPIFCASIGAAVAPAEPTATRFVHAGARSMQLSEAALRSMRERDEDRGISHETEDVPL